MALTKQSILDKTHYGLNIYSFILRKYYPNTTVLSLSGKVCKPAKNPFNKGKETLHIEIWDNVAKHIDVEGAIGSGDVFDFASKYFKKQGDELLEIINTELNLHIDEERLFYKDNEYVEVKDKAKVIIPKVSYFKCPVSNTIPEKEVDLSYIYNLVKYNHFEKQTEKLRAITDKKEARKYKAYNFHYVTFSGTFSKRNDKALINHSGLLTIDFDHIKDIEKLKGHLLNDEYFETELMFTSPSGDGLKWIIPINLEIGSHQENFLAISYYIRATYNIEVDASGKDISRACFLPHDKAAYINPKYL